LKELTPQKTKDKTQYFSHHTQRITSYSASFRCGQRSRKSSDSSSLYPHLLLFRTYNEPCDQPVQPYTTLRFSPYDNEPHDRDHAFHISRVSFYRRHKLL